MKSIKSCVQDIQNQKLSAVDYCSQFLDKIQSTGGFNSITQINDSLLEQAKEIDLKIQRKERVGRLAGIPLTVKEMICTKEMRTTAASKALETYRSPFDATLISNLKKESALILGKCNQDEFAMGSSSEHSVFGSVKNPINQSYVAGGSSGGSAASVAGHLAPASIGTDTGGSIRQPAHFCGVVGVKPTYGRVSRYGVIAYASSLDQAGPLTKSVEDAAFLLEITSGKDSNDSTTSKKMIPNWSEKIQQNINGLSVGVMRPDLKMDFDQDVIQAFDFARKWAEESGAKIVEIELPLQEILVPTYYLISASEASSNLSRYDGVRFGHRSKSETNKIRDLQEFYSQTRAEAFGLEVKRRILMGTYFLSSGYIDQYFHKACQVRRKILNETLEIFKDCDVLLSPVATTKAFRLGEKIKDPLEMYLNDILTVRANLCGLPAMSLPVLSGEEGLPVGVQIIGQHFQEQEIFNLASAIESKAGFWEGR